MTDPSAIGLMEGAYFVSKRDLLSWLKREFAVNISKIEECGNGVTYLKIMDKLFPGKVPMKKAKLIAKQEWECLHNLKLLQAVFMDANIKKHLDIDRLAKCMYLDNLEFLQWMKCFYDRYLGITPGEESPCSDRGVPTFSSAASNSSASKPPLRPASASVVRSGSGSLRQRVSDSRPATGASGTRLMNASALRNSRSDSGELSRLKEQLEEKNDTLQQLQTELATSDQECHFYFKKLRMLELLSLQQGRETLAVKEVQEILFTEDDLSDRIEEAETAVATASPAVSS